MYKFAALVLMAGTLAAPSSTGITRDGHGVQHIRASNAHDLFYRQGWAHAEDRLFQMDVTRRRASGTLAGLLGPSALPGDMQMRTLGLRRAAERTPPLLSS
ncbi:penicillin acylase family protein [Actinoplanes sp. NPDC051513]|uniref:penicillin acylase family protein n=1 Tax=Actinoplanes sp. NPDC051513 TaxID=3363908 RepID=UPI0037A93F39